MPVQMTSLAAVVAALILLPSRELPPQDPLEECTAGVASGRATADGRPLLWKTRDASATNNEVIWNTSGTYHFVSVISAGDEASSWMGVNERGFSIINTLSMDLPTDSTGMHNGLFMAYAHVAHDCHVGSNTIFANNATLAGHVEVGDYATIGALSAVHQFCRVGPYAFLGGFTAATRDCLPYMNTTGNQSCKMRHVDH